jgi:hypothetical protein
LADRWSFLRAAIVFGLVLVNIAAPGLALAGERETGADRHVLLLSVDGLHQSDLAFYVANTRAPRSHGSPRGASSSPTRECRSRPTRSRV